MDSLALAAQNLTSPMVLCFALGLAAALARSDLSIPEPIAKALSIYLLFAIGMKGGTSVAAHGVDATLLGAIFAGAVLSALIPVIAFIALRAISGLSRVDAAAVAAHYGSISIVTFVAGTSALGGLGIDFEGYMVAVAAVMEAPAILVALYLARSAASPEDAAAAEEEAHLPGEPNLMREVLLNGSIVLLVGAFAIGVIIGPAGAEEIAPFTVDPFKGVLCLFLLDMGLIAGRGLRSSVKYLSPPVLLFGLVAPFCGAALGLAAAAIVGLSVGGAALLAVLSASASYIAVPAAMRVALPQAQPAIYLTLSLGVTFPMNLTLGIPVYIAAAQAFLA
ncbi:MAG: sodium-dependent bicarbonate transport family permease [Pseudomonadota bacterium]